MTATTINAAIAADESGLISVITLAFSSDPMARWSQPDPQKYLANFPPIVRAFGGNAFSSGTAYYADRYAGAALWLPPGVGPDEESLGRLIAESAPEEIRDDLQEIFEQMEKFHPSEPHWYLPMIGVDPSKQGAGVGSTLMKHTVAACDRDRIIAYLESSNPRNISLYERHGFEVIGEIQAGSSPILRPMLRKPQ